MSEKKIVIPTPPEVDLYSKTIMPEKELMIAKVKSFVDLDYFDKVEYERSISDLVKDWVRSKKKYNNWREEISDIINSKSTEGLWQKI